MHTNSFYRCPVCGGALVQEEKAYVCANRHSFDISAEGYVNLAPAKSAVGTVSGDAADTCRARRRFLESGAYQPLAEALGERLYRNGAVGENNLVIDAGCGEGYYMRALKARFPQLDLYGVDLAKQGVKMAAKLEKNSARKNHYAVAGIFKLPFAEESAAAMLSVFAPVADAEALRVLKPGGVLVVACPGKEHLYGLKQALYETPTENEEKIPEYPGFSLLETGRITYEMRLSGEQAADLFAMTPYFWRSSAEVREKSAVLGETLTKADFLVKVYRKQKTVLA